MDNHATTAGEAAGQPGQRDRWEQMRGRIAKGKRKAALWQPFAVLQFTDEPIPTAYPQVEVRAAYFKDE